MIAIVLAVIFVLIFYPVFRWLKGLLWGKGGIAAFLSTLALFLFLILPAGLAATLITDQLLQFVRHLSGEGGLGMLTQKWTTDILPVLSQRISERVGYELNLTALLNTMAAQAAHYVTGFSPRVVTGTAKFFLNFLVMHIAVYFLFLEGPNLYRFILHLSPLKDEHEKKLADGVRNMISASVYGYVFTALAQGGLGTLGYWIAGVEAPMVFGTLTFLTSFIPLIGATAVWLPVGITLLAVGKLKSGIFLLIYGAAVIASIDNIVKPIVIKGKTDIHPLLIFFAIFGGLNMMGPIGILIGPVLIAVLLACLKIYREEYL